MFERSEKAGNALSLLHDEEYRQIFQEPNLNWQGFFFTHSRDGESLDGPWNFTLDLYDTGLRQKWYELDESPEISRTKPWDYDPFLGDTISLPSCWNLLKAEWYLYEGAVWYTRLVRSEGGRKLLRVGAANYQCLVFLNGRFLGRHLGGSTPFFVWLELEQGQNRLQLCVDNQRSAQRVPMHHTDWFNYGGVYREVGLYTIPERAIKDLFVYLVPDGSYQQVAVELEATQDGSATVYIEELGIQQDVILKDRRGRVVLDCKPELWSPANPKLYEVEIRFGDDRVRDQIGFRQIERRGTELYLNGENLFLRGISVHEDDERWGKVCTEEDLVRRFAHAKELGCNFLRLAHYPHHQRAARLADEQGLLLWEEIPVYWAIDFSSQETLDDACNQMKELILRDRNRASVILWSVGNENADTDERLQFMSDLCHLTREFDPTRLVGAACLVNLQRGQIEDRLAEHLDVIGINEYYGWYYPNFEEFVEVGKQSAPDRPVVISETGAGALAGHHGEVGEFFTEEHMAWVYQKQFELLEKLPWVRGVSPWILYDFRAERRQNRFQKGWNRKGLLAQDKSTKKLAFEVVKDTYERWRES